MSDLLLTEIELPDGFRYPAELRRIVDLGLLELEPWHVLVGDQLRARHRGLRERFPERNLVPLARRLDSDDVACFDVLRGDIAVVHDFASPGWEGRRRHSGFREWFLAAVEEMLDFE